MALIHQAQLTPTKLELIDAWVRSQPWWAWDGAGIDLVGAYRFDDPAGAVGIETHLVGVGGERIVQVPLTYRGAPLADAESALVGTMQHSVLGERWVYDACDDPVYVTALATAILTGGREAELQVESDNGYQLREPTARVTGSGRPGTAIPPTGLLLTSSDKTSTTVSTTSLDLVLRRVLDGDEAVGSAQTLRGSWRGNAGPTVLAWVTQAN
jgi:hypothetical protein